MNKVWIPNVPSRWDDSIDGYYPLVNISPARQFGEPEIILTPQAIRQGIAPSKHIIDQKMRDFGPDDWLLGIGDPVLIGYCAFRAASAIGRLRMLRWDKQMRGYLPIEI